MRRDEIERGAHFGPSSSQKTVDEAYGEIEGLADNHLSSKEGERISLFFELGDRVLKFLAAEERDELGERLKSTKTFNQANLSLFADRLTRLASNLIITHPEDGYDCFAMSHALLGQPMAIVSDVKETLAMYTGGEGKVFPGVKDALFECAEVGPVFFLSGDTKDALIDGFLLTLGICDRELHPDRKISRSILENFHIAPHTGAIILYLRAGDKKFRTEGLLGGISTEDLEVFKSIAKEAEQRFSLGSRYGWLDTEKGKGPGWFNAEEILPGNSIFDFYPLGVVKQHERLKLGAHGSHRYIIKEILKIFDWINEEAASRGAVSGKISLGGLSTGDGRSGTKGDAIKVIKGKFLPSNAKVTAIGDRIDKDGNDADMVVGSDYAVHVGNPNVAEPEVYFKGRRIVSSSVGSDGGATPFLLSAARANRWFQVLAPNPPSLSSETLGLV